MLLAVLQMRFTQIFKPITRPLPVLFLLTFSTTAHATTLTPEVSIPQKTTSNVLTISTRESETPAPITAQKEHSSLPQTCAHIRYTKVNITEKGVSYHNLTLTIPSDSFSQQQTPYRLHAAQMQLTAQPFSSLPQPKNIFNNMAEAASVALVLSLTGHHNAACAHWLEKQGQQAWRFLIEGKNMAFSWNAATISLGKVALGLKSAQLILQGSTHDKRSEASLAFNGLDYHNIAYEAFFPSQAHVTFSIPASELPTFLSTLGTTTAKADQAIHIHVTDLNASRGDIALHGYGQATFTGDMHSSTASGHLEISHLDTLIALTRAERQMNLMAALVLARLVSHHTDTANTWNTAWENGVLTINGFPLPSLIK